MKTKAERFLSTLSEKLGVPRETLVDTYNALKTPDQVAAFISKDLDLVAPDQPEDPMHPADQHEMIAVEMNGAELLWRWAVQDHGFTHTLTLPGGKVLDWKD